MIAGTDCRLNHHLDPRSPLRGGYGRSPRLPIVRYMSAHPRARDVPAAYGGNCHGPVATEHGSRGTTSTGRRLSSPLGTYRRIQYSDAPYGRGSHESGIAGALGLGDPEQK